MGARLVNKFLYPAPNPPHYECDSFPHHTIWVPRSDQKNDSTIPCLLIRSNSAKNLILYAHGNGCDIGDMKMELEYYSHTLRAHVCAFELRGYGFNQGTPSEGSICSDIRDVYDYFTTQNPEGKFPFKNVILWGRSIGSGPTTWLASRLCEEKVEIAGLILQSPFTSIKAAAQHIAGNMVGALLSNRWNNQVRIKGIKAPVLIIHGKMDTLIPYSHAEVLHEACTSRNKRLVLSETADHNRFDFANDIVLPVSKFMQELCSNSFDWGDRVNAKCPSSLYKIPEFAKKMHVKARNDKKIREIENPGTEEFTGFGRRHAKENIESWKMGVGWEERMVNQATTAAEILRSLLDSTPNTEWEKNDIVQELKATIVTSQQELIQRLGAVEEPGLMDKLLKCNDMLLSTIQACKDGGTKKEDRKASDSKSKPAQSTKQA
ncbi:hypothetical protein AAMO2058_001048200 [Amorphochlora amoebiformis]|uniref:Serine aminopeptidase S33 domain-containing protein n=1 Tax=Amorphochlora amoebiformis TaxID=1561963 RepID=A0A7S0GQM2_9EUKA|mmetsp:Transcript_13920/g.22023  ORF Transcript_13920/g.22023 Transcript_13920/m.22023 type:complete len:433 (+) Transcript_13920:113-1411(+)